MLFAAPGWVVDAGVIFGALVAFGTFAGLVSRSPIGRWFGKQLSDQFKEWVEQISDRSADRALENHVATLETQVSERLEEMLPRHLLPILHELRSNGGGSFRDQVMRELRELQLRHDRVALFMDESTMDRRELRRQFHDEIARTKLADHGEVDDREEDPE